MLPACSPRPPPPRLPSAFPRPCSTTATCPEAHRRCRRRRRRAEARHRTHQRCLSCPAADFCPSRLSRRRLRRHLSRRTLKTPATSIRSRCEDKCQEQRRERRHVNVTFRALASALLDSPPAARRLEPPPPACPFPRPQSTTTTSLQACCDYGAQKWRADARETTRQRCPSCSATHPCAPRLSCHRAHPAGLPIPRRACCRHGGG